MAKKHKILVLFIFIILPLLIVFLMGHIYVLRFHAIVIIGILEIIFRTGKFRSFKFNVLANAIFSCWICGSISQMIFVKEQYMEMIVKSMGEEFAKTL